MLFNVEDFLTYGQINYSRFKPQESSFDVRDALHEIVKMISLKAKGNDIDLRLTVRGLPLQ